MDYIKIGQHVTGLTQNGHWFDSEVLDIIKPGGSDRITLQVINEFGENDYVGPEHVLTLQ